MVDANLVKLAIDGYKGHVAGNYSVSDAQETLRAALVEANGGKTSFDIKDVRAGRCEKVFTIVEELVNAISEEGLRGDEFFMNMVEDRNMALGDTPVFHIERDSLLAVADIAEGTQGVRRQRIEGGTDITVTTQLHAVKIYEELNRVLSGRIDFNKLVDLVSRSFVKNELDSAYAAFTGMFNKLQAPYSESGSYDEEKLLTLVEHVEAATGQTAMIVGTRRPCVRSLLLSCLIPQRKICTTWVTMARLLASRWLLLNSVMRPALTSSSWMTRTCTSSLAIPSPLSASLRVMLLC